MENDFMFLLTHIKNLEEKVSKIKEAGILELNFI